MLLSFWLGIVIAIISGCLAIYIIYKLLRKAKAGQKASGGVGVTLGMLLGIIIIVSAGKVVIVKSSTDYGEYLVYGKPTYEFKNGYKLNLNMGSNQGFLINDTERPIVIEKFLYSNSGYNNDFDVLCLPLSVTKMPSAHVSYFFNDRPPSSISSNNDVTKYWVRTKSAYESEYGKMNYDKAYVSILAEPHNTASD
ncbi:MAG: hypothetical protein ACI857_000984 [Arenicella sp.]|jgi:hypothetical protein